MRPGIGLSAELHVSCLVCMSKLLPEKYVKTEQMQCIDIVFEVCLFHSIQRNRNLV